MQDEGPTVREELVPQLYRDLRKLAASKLAQEAAGHTLQPTALVHEVWLRLAQGNQPFENRTHFFATAAETMRKVLIDHARKKKALKRGAGAPKIDLDEVDVAINTDHEVLLRIDEALEKLNREDPRAAEVVRLRFFVGLTNLEAAQALGISERSAKRFWTFARAWLYQQLIR